MSAGLVGGILGAVIGTLGGMVGTYFSIKNTNGPRERAFMIKSAVVCWVAVCAFVALVLLLPVPYRYLPWVVYVPLLFLGIRYGNRRQHAIKLSEARRSEGVRRGRVGRSAEFRPQSKTKRVPTDHKD